MKADKTFETYCSTDPAIDTAAMPIADMRRYTETRDASRLKFKPGERASLFTLRNLPTSVVNALLDEGRSEGGIHRLAFAASVVRVRDAVIDGVALPTWAPSSIKDGLTVEEVEAFDAREVQEIGRVAWDRSFLGRAIAGNYVLPQSCRELLGRLTYLPAVASGANTNSEKHSDEAESTDQAAE